MTGLRYLGADIVFDRAHGHLVLEVNARPGLEIQNVQGRVLALSLAGAPSTDVDLTVLEPVPAAPPAPVTVCGL